VRQTKGSGAGRSATAGAARAGALAGIGSGALAFASQQEVGAIEWQGTTGSWDPWLAGIPAQQSPEASAAPTFAAMPSSITASTNTPALRRLETITIE